MDTKKIDKKRWFILAACCLINLCLGSVYAWSVFSSSMADYFTNVRGLSVTTGDLAIVYTICNGVGPITMISGGWINDKIGPKLVILTGGLMFALGMFLSGFATGIGFLILTYGLLSGLGLGMAYGCTISTCVKYFPDKRGLIGGITTAVYGFSSVILPPIVSAIVNASDVTVAFKGIGIVFLVIIAACGIFLTPCPADYTPTGYIAPVAAGASDNDKNWREMLKTPLFYVMLILLMCGAFSGMMIISQAAGLAQNMVGMTSARASAVVSLLALFNVLGRLLSGYISDRVGRINTLRIACMISIVGLVCLYVSNSNVVVLFYIGISMVGISFGSFMGVFPGFTADQFGAKNNSVNYGIMFIGFALAGYFGPQIMRGVYAAYGIYQNAFLIAAGLSAIGVLLTFVYQKSGI